LGFENQYNSYSLAIKWFQREQAAQHEPEDVDPDIAAMMGFGGFGSSKK
jgi:U4/U6.U5 tri-snRNP component SNU23